MGEREGEYTQDADKSDHPHSVQRSLGLGVYGSKDTAIRKAVVARDGVKRSSCGLQGGLHDGEGGEADEDPEDQGAC